MQCFFYLDSPFYLPIGLAFAYANVVVDNA